MGYEYSMNVFICGNLTEEKKDIIKRKVENLIQNLNKEILILK